MNDLLANFLKEGAAALADAPYDFMGDPTGAGIDGLQAALFLEWAAGKGLLSSAVQEGLSSIEATWSAQPSQRAAEIRSILGGSLQPAHLSDDGQKFANLYYRPGWIYSYLVDLERLFPEVSQLAEIEPSKANAARINQLLDERLGQSGLGKKT